MVNNTKRFSMKKAPKSTHSKRFIATAMIALFASSAFSQLNTNLGGTSTSQLQKIVARSEPDKGKFATFGFDLGVNRSDLRFGETQMNGDAITNGFGYRLGVVSNLQFTKRFSLMPRAELSFNATKLDQNTVSYEVNAVNLEFMAHFKYKFSKGKFSPYILSGPNLRVPLFVDNSDYVPTKQDVAIDAGVGFDFPLGSVKISPELRYSFGLTNISESNNFSDLKSNNIALMLIFTGM